MAKATLLEIMRFFQEPSAAKFRGEWNALTDTDKEALREGIGNGTLTY